MVKPHRFNNRQQEIIIANDRIRFPQVRVTGPDGDSLGVMPTNQALQAARNHELDLVLVTDKAEIPVCKITDLNKFLFEKKRQAKEQAKKQRESRIELKEIQFRPGIDKHDFETKCNHIRKFISKGNHVKLMVRFRGREMANTKVGFDIINRLMEEISGLEFESKPQLNGNRLIAIIKSEK
jgi:translation initiation factor IF-3